MRTIPPAPARLRFEIRALWNGARCTSGVRGALELSVTGEDLAVRAELLAPGPPRVPAAPAGTRVEGLWVYDVVECFLAGAGGRYLEIELGAAGHFLVLSFAARRARASACERLVPRAAHGLMPGGWWAALRVPRALLPPGLRAGAAFANADGQLLAHHPLAGAAADFHQPDAWPALRLGG